MMPLKQAKYPDDPRRSVEEEEFDDASTADERPSGAGHGGRGRVPHPRRGGRMVSVKHEIVEGVAGMWHYHLRVEGELRALCGAMVMRTSIPLERWNKKIPDHHIPEPYCSKCDGLRGDK